MNEYILVAMDRKNRSDEELRKNCAADNAARAADNAARAAANAARAAADAAWAAADADAARASAADVEFWVNEYFERTGEDREDYEKALKEMKK